MGQSSERTRGPAAEGPLVTSVSPETIRHLIETERELLGGCPDGGYCHHDCKTQCWRVSTCLPLAAYGEDWSAEDKAAHAHPEVDGVRVEDLLLGGYGSAAPASPGS